MSARWDLARRLLAGGIVVAACLWVVFTDAQKCTTTSIATTNDQGTVSSVEETETCTPQPFTAGPVPLALVAAIVLLAPDLSEVTVGLVSIKRAVETQNQETRSTIAAENQATRDSITAAVSLASSQAAANVELIVDPGTGERTVDVKPVPEVKQDLVDIVRESSVSTVQQWLTELGADPGAISDTEIIELSQRILNAQVSDDDPEGPETV